MNSKIIYIDNMQFYTEKQVELIPYDAEYIIIGNLGSGLFCGDYEGFFDIPVLCKKVIIFSYEKCILEEYKTIEEYIESIAGHKIPFGCEIVVGETKNGSSWSWTTEDNIEVIDGKYYHLYNLNKWCSKGIYDVLRINLGKIKDDDDIIYTNGKKTYLKINDA